MKQADYTLFAIWILSLAFVVQPVFADEAREQALCVTDKTMAESIQQVRITSHDSFEVYKTKVSKWSKPGKPLGYAVTPDQIAEKDKFWQKNLAMAALVYEFYPVGYSPEYVGNQILVVCQWKFHVNRLQKESAQKFEL